ncbi:restriction endonuclease subunit S [Methylocucumis oryzae]|uniref:restriction endonuclease subunit S n=1 Tax=Methylocucumis oryzae TaxID=1632867 RepID=UPI000697C1E1|nr:restriction endonuclease subunit S [Methylocucumis oryzae]
MAGRYQAYPEYKDSGVETLGAIPAHWETRQVRFLLKDGAEGIKIGPFGSALKLEDMVDDGIRVYGQENVIKKDFTLGKRRISSLKFLEMQVYQIQPLDLLITMMGTSGKCELVPQDVEQGIIDSHLLRLRVKEENILPRYFRLLIDDCHEIKSQIEVNGKGSIMHGLNSSIVKALLLPLPNKTEQANILEFIGHETAKIDNLIEKQQQLIQLLKEKTSGSD